MSASTIFRAANDVQLQNRVQAMAMKEINANPALGQTDYGRQLQQGVSNIMPLMWPVAVSTEAAYESALLNMRGAPGFDTDIITDADLTAAIVAGWPGGVPVPPPGPVPTVAWATGAPGTLFVQADVTNGTPSVNYTVEWGDGGGAGLLTLDASGVGAAAHNYVAAGSYAVAVNDENGNEIAGATTVVVS